MPSHPEKEAEKLVCLCGQQRAQESKHKCQGLSQTHARRFSDSPGAGGQLPLFLPAVTTGFCRRRRALGRGMGGLWGLWHIASASQGLQPLVFHSLTLMDVQAALDQAGVFILPRRLCAGRTELQRWVAPCVQWHLDFGPSLQQCSPHRLLFTTWGLQTQQ